MKDEFEKMGDSSPPYWEDNPLLPPCITNTGVAFCGCFFHLLQSSPPTSNFAHVNLLP